MKNPWPEFPKRDDYHIPDKYLAHMDHILYPTGEVVCLKVHAKLRNNLPVIIKGIYKELAEDKDKEIGLLKSLKTLSTDKCRRLVRIFDVLESPEWLYCVMEFCEGGDLKAQMHKGLFCPPDSKKIVKGIIIPVLEAVDSLHQSKDTFVHRDIKPANIMHTREGNQGFYKIGDYGLVKSDKYVDDYLSSQGTPYYMAPEMERNASPEDKQKRDHRCDIYSIGIILRELITQEKPPYRNPLDEKPNELHQIINKAIKQDPDERYRSAQVFIDDLNDYLKGKQPSHLLPQDKPKLSLSPKTKSGRKTRRIPTLLPTLGKKRELLYRQGNYREAIPIAEIILRETERKYGKEHPSTATALNNLALLYANNGDYASAEPLYKRALEIREKKLGKEHPDTANSLNNLAELYTDKNDYASAEPLYKRALEIREKKLGLDHPATGGSLNNLALLYVNEGDPDKAEPLLKQALAIAEEHLGSDHHDTATALNNLAMLYTAKNDYASAEPLYKRALEIREKQLGPNHPDTAISLNNLAELYRAKGEYDKAEPLFKRALTIIEKQLGSDHPHTATLLNNMAMLYTDKDDYASAEPLYKRALTIAEKQLGPDHPDTATALNNLATLYANKGEKEKAKKLRDRALKILQKSLPPEHPHIKLVKDNLKGLEQTT